MSRLTSLILLAGALALALPAAALADDRLNVSDETEIVGGDSTLSGLTGMLVNPEAYTQGAERVIVGLHYLDGEGDLSSWVPTILVGIDNRFEFGAFGGFNDGDAEDMFGASIKFKFYDEHLGSEIEMKETENEGGWPSMAGFYTLSSNSDITRHRAGLVASWTFMDEEEESADFNNTTFSAGAVYNFIDADSADTEFPENDFDWYAGLNFNVDDNWSFVAEYEDDDDEFGDDGLAAALRYRFPMDNETGQSWMVEAGVQDENIVAGVQVDLM